LSYLHDAGCALVEAETGEYAIDRAIHFNGDGFLSRRHAVRISLD
jgi:hypothetical protein